MKGLAILPSVRWPVTRRKAAHPYREQSVTDALAALPDEPEATRPVPTFTPNPGLRDTVPVAALPAGVLAAPAASADMAVLARVHDAMARKWHTETFIADRRELPFFRALTKELGWQGLHMPPRPAGFQRWSTEGWLAREKELTDAAYMRARVTVLGDPGAVRARADDGFHMITGGAA